MLTLRMALEIARAAYEEALRELGLPPETIKAASVLAARKLAELDDDHPDES